HNLSKPPHSILRPGSVCRWFAQFSTQAEVSIGPESSRGSGAALPLAPIARTISTLAKTRFGTIKQSENSTTGLCNFHGPLLLCDLSRCFLQDGARSRGSLSFLGAPKRWFVKPPL